MSYKILTAEEAASLIKNGDNIAFSGFTPAGAAKAIPTAIAERAKAEHAAGNAFKIKAITGASGGPSLDGVLALADALEYRAPYQSNADMRKAINAGSINFVDMHLSMTPQYMNYGFMGEFDWAIVEAADVSDSGEILLTTSVGISPTGLKLAKKVLIELNRHHSKGLLGMHDIYETANPPHRREIPIYTCSDRIGSKTVKIDPSKIVGIVETDRPDEVGGFKPADPITTKVGENVANFLASEMKAGRIPQEFLPIQSGVGNIANAVLGAMGANPDIPQFSMFSEVLQDSVIDMLANGNMKFASATSLTVTSPKLQEIYDNMKFFHDKIVLRPQEISNNPELVRRLGIISINTAIEVDLFGNVNSSHIMG
ncbi:MAG: acetyl-CoA hydrolase, partial [Opitutales bacterium]|nr:acetyl-CoA hydrolase [Opitutales bacterium]